uniref:Zgc:64051 n=1 Tax=Neogobius melanostomus TaxID=47308 RepID=A0A8C6SLV7_9GOBI
MPQVHHVRRQLPVFCLWHLRAGPGNLFICEFQDGGHHSVNGRFWRGSYFDDHGHHHHLCVLPGLPGRAQREPLPPAHVFPNAVPPDAGGVDFSLSASDARGETGTSTATKTTTTTTTNIVRSRVFFQIDGFLQRELKEGLKKAKQANTTILTDWDLVQRNLGCCGVINASDWQPNVPGPPNNSPALLPMDKEKKLPYVPESCCVDQCNESPPKYHQLGCYQKLKDYFEENFLYIGITIIVFCIIEVLGMCFAMTLFCHISRTGLGYKL